LQAARILPDSHLQSEAELVASALLTTIECNGWICANPAGVESPGLMTGIAGIGYGFLRFADPDRVPSVLALEPPPGH
jgi:lantibiotic modifying enzyme